MDEVCELRRLNRCWVICAGWGCSTRVDEGEEDVVAFFPREPSFPLGVDGEEVEAVAAVAAAAVAEAEEIVDVL